MKKSAKKLDRNIVQSLTFACEDLKQSVPGFEWLTHTVNYDHFPGSLIITCVFDTNQDIKNTLEKQLDKKIHNSIQQHLSKLNIQINPAKQIFFDSEEACNNQHGGNWSARL